MPAEDGARVQSNNGHAAASSPKRHHAVVVPWPGQGHINPLLHLSRTLAAQYGFSITFVNLDFAHRLLMSSLRRQEEQELEACPTPGAKLDITFVSVPDGISAEAIRSVNESEICRGVIESGPAFERLLVGLRPPPTCIISDIFMLHTQDAANKVGIPRISFWTQSAASFSAHLLAARGSFPSDYGEENMIENIAGAPPLRFKDLSNFLQPHKVPQAVFDFVIQPFTRLEEARCILMNTFMAMEAEALQTLRQEMPRCKFYSIGPILPLDYFSGMNLSNSTLNKAPGFWAEDYSCLQWLDTQKEGSVLYVSFGSIAEFSEQELQELALGLEASGIPILWVLRRSIDIQVNEECQQASLPPHFQERTQGRVYIIDWAPQLHVLAHPSIAAFFTHAGWNSILEGLSQGKPLLGYPYFADQMLNSRCVEEYWGIGLALDRHGEGHLTHSLVESKILALMNDTKLRENTILLRDGARRAILSPGHESSTSNLIESLCL